MGPAKAHARHLPVVLIQSGIHPGEIEGADAGLMLPRGYPQGTRVKAVYDLVAELPGQINRHPDTLLVATARADADTVAEAPGLTARSLALQTGPGTALHELQAYAWTLSASTISGPSWIHDGRSRQRTLSIPDWNRLLPDIRVTGPATWAIPAPWTEIIDRIKAYDLSCHRLSQAATIIAQNGQLSDPVWASHLFEGHRMRTRLAQSRQQRTLRLPPGAIVVLINPRGRAGSHRPAGASGS